MKNDLNKEDTDYLKNVNQEQEPMLFQILLHKDDFTPMDFVIDMLEKFFYMDRCKAMGVMTEARIEGKALCGAYAKDYAEAKISQVLDYARTHEHPLICSMEAAV